MQQKPTVLRALLDSGAEEKESRQKPRGSPGSQPALASKPHAELRAKVLGSLRPTQNQRSTQAIVWVITFS